ncbi:hypothetical protein ACFXQA_14515 [Microbacterium sp. P07]|uniref:hypothetical protein n=1 Tax=Microbacterium sp. P07 TaxID=3366952 RepID=UPI0037473B51
MAITIRLQGSTNGRGERSGEIHDLNVEELPDRVQNHLDTHRRENYDLRWGGDVVHRDEYGYTIYGFVGTDESSLVRLGQSKHPEVSDDTMYVRPPSYSDLHAQADDLGDEEAGISPEDLAADGRG